MSFPPDAGDLIGAQFAAAEELGMRMVASRGSMDLSRKDGGLPPDSVVQTVDAIMKDSARVIEAYHDPSFGSMRQVVLAPCSPFSVSGELLRQSAILARQYGVRLHTHLCETRDEEHYTLEHYGVRPLEYMASLGWTGPDVWYAHGIHFNDEELRELARTGTGVAHCPISNMKLASGVARVPEMLALDVPVGLAVDGSASNDGSSLMEELRVCYLLHRLTSSEKAPSGYQVLKMATRGSARLLGREDIGQLAVGKCADFFLVDYTVVNGRVVVKEGISSPSTRKKPPPMPGCLRGRIWQRRKEPLHRLMQRLFLFINYKGAVVQFRISVSSARINWIYRSRWPHSASCRRLTSWSSAVRFSPASPFRRLCSRLSPNI